MALPTAVPAPATLPREIPEKPSIAYIAPVLFLAAALAIYAHLSSTLAVPGITVVRFFCLGLTLFAAGFVSGLAGFAFSAVGALILLLIEPRLAVPLLQGLSTVNQLTSISTLRKEMPRTWDEWWPSGPGPAILGGFVGIPVGVWILNQLPAITLTLIIGVLITAYALFSIFKPDGVVLRGCDGAFSGIVVGALGGALGGFTAFPGMTVVVWTALRDTPKSVTRSIVQPFVVALQIFALLTNGLLHPAVFSVRYWLLFALLVPIVLPGTMTGVKIYRSMSDRDFKRFCLLLLVLSGVGLISKALF